MKRVLVMFGFVAACGSDSAQTPPTDVPPDTGGASAEGWTPLLGRSWTLSPGSTNTYKCTRIQIAEDMWVSGFRAMSPLGTHHSVLTISTSNTQTGDYDCTAGSVDNQMLFASGVGTDDLAFPPGVAIHIAAGTYINLNLHLFNASDNPIDATSGVLVKRVAPVDVQHEADMMFSGTLAIAIPHDGMLHTAQGGCAAPADWHVFTLWPHMHQTATHQTWTYAHDGVTTTLLDDDYTFTEQKNYPIADTLIHQGDRVETVCSYVNNTLVDIGFGDGSDKEMCFTGMYKYPAGGNQLDCTTLPQR
jgi:hypothetical protein